MKMRSTRANSFLMVMMGKYTIGSWGGLNSSGSHVRAYYNNGTTVYKNYYFPTTAPIGAMVGGVLTPGNMPIPQSTGNGVPEGNITSVVVETNWFTDISFGLAGSGAEATFSSLAVVDSPQLINFDIKVPKWLGPGVFINETMRTHLLKMIAGTGESYFFVTNTSGVATLKVYSGTPPDTADMPATGTLLWEKPLINTAFNNAADGAIALAAPLDANALASGTVGYARIVNSTSNSVMQFNSVGTAGAVMTTADTTTQGASFGVSSLTLIITPII